MSIFKWSPEIVCLLLLLGFGIVFLDNLVLREALRDRKHVTERAIKEAAEWKDLTLQLIRAISTNHYDTNFWNPPPTPL